MKRESPAQMSFGRGLFWIALSVLFCSGSIGGGWLVWSRWQERKKNDPKYFIRSVIHETTGEILPEGVLPAWLGLSVDCPTHLYGWNQRRATERLRESSLFSEISLTLDPPESLIVAYKLREPYAAVYEWVNTVVDREGHRFPNRPYFSPKQLPMLILGEESQESRLSEALAILGTIEKPLANGGWRIISLDISNYGEVSSGKREGILQLYSPAKEQTCYLRFSPESFRQAVANYLSLMHHHSDSTEKGGRSRIVDARLPHLAFMKEIIG